MSERNDPLRIEYGREVDGLTIVRQSAPAGAASFSATYVGPGGWGFDLPQEAGTARVVNQLLTSGAGRLNRVALARRLDSAGATLTAECAPESAEVTIWGPAADWRKLLGLLSDVVLRPRFETVDLDRVLRQLAERQLREIAQPGSRADRELFRAAYPDGHPYRTSGLGDRRSVSRLTTEKLRRFHQRHYTSGEAVLVVTAPARLPAVEIAATKWFSGFPETRAPALRLPTVRASAPRTIRVELKGRAQVEIRIGGGSIPRSEPEYAAAFLANEVLGGRGQLSRLFQRVREQGGLVYHASSDLEAMRLGGYWTVAAGTGPDRWPKVVPLLTEELDRLGDRNVPAPELDMIRESVIGEMPLALESTSDAHELAVEVAYHRLPGDYLARWPGLLRAIRPKDVRNAVERTMDRRRALTVLAGPLARP
ncbi:MAG TPA: pitrilysin family protein [Thermoplasmata archaeon]|nr:pitrilysin family protein [Thermoplasmata archaeon]